MEIPEWTKKYNEQISSDPRMRDVSLVVLIIDAKIDNRVTANEKLIAAVVDEAFKAINPENMVLVINKAYTGYNVTDGRNFYM